MRIDERLEIAKKNLDLAAAYLAKERFEDTQMALNLLAGTIENLAVASSSASLRLLAQRDR